MKRSIAMSWCAGLALVLVAAPVSAQTTVQGSVIVQSGPTPLGDRARRVMGAEVVVVERVQGRHGWWRRPGYRMVIVYTDGERFYRRPFGRTVLRKAEVYERGGRYYINDGEWKRHRDYHDERYGRDERYGHNDRDDRNGRDDDNSHGNGRDHHDNGNHYGWDNH
jgi:hypothetical protein